MNPTPPIVRLWLAALVGLVSVVPSISALIGLSHWAHPQIPDATLLYTAMIVVLGSGLGLAALFLLWFDRQERQRPAYTSTVSTISMGSKWSNAPQLVLSSSESVSEASASPGFDDGPRTTDQPSEDRTNEPTREPAVDEPVFIGGIQKSYLDLLREQLRSRADQKRSALVFVGSALLFLAIRWLGNASGGLAEVVSIGVTLLIHELGHAAMMAMLGYRDVRIFFLPFFGGLASGRLETPVAWKECLVLLAGPVPGIVLALVLVILAPSDSPRWFLSFIDVLIWINALNLLPLGSLDGGRLVQITLFSRAEWLEFGFVVIGALCLAGLSLLMQNTPLLIFSIMPLFSLGRRRDIRRTAALIHERWVMRQIETPTVAASDLDDLELATLVKVTTDGLPIVNKQPTLMPSMLRAVYDEARRVAPSIWVTLLFLFMYFGAWFWALVDFVLLVVRYQS